MKDPEKNNIFAGEFWTGKSALKLGLIDGIGNADQIPKRKNLVIKLLLKTLKREKDF